MEKIDINLSREELRVKMCELQNEAYKYREAIDRIDKAKEVEYRNSIINKCYQKDYEYMRVEKFNENERAIGTKLYIYGEEMGSIEINHEIWEDSIKEAINISHEKFNEVLSKLLNELYSYENNKNKNNSLSNVAQ
jgi:hypothetical protein